MSTTAQAEPPSPPVLAATVQESASPSPEALQADPEWQGYLSRLQQSGFFGGHAPGAAQFGGLLQEAARRLGAVRAHRRRAARVAQPAAWLRQLLQVSRMWGGSCWGAWAGQGGEGTPTFILHQSPPSSIQACGFKAEWLRLALTGATFR